MQLLFLELVSFLYLLIGLILYKKGKVLDTRAFLSKLEF